MISGGSKETWLTQDAIMPLMVSLNRVVRTYIP